MVVPKSDSFRPRTAPAKATPSTKPAGAKAPERARNKQVGGKQAKDPPKQAHGKTAHPTPSIESEIQRLANQERLRGRREAATQSQGALGRSRSADEAQAARVERNLDKVETARPRSQAGAHSAPPPPRSPTRGQAARVEREIYGTAVPAKAPTRVPRAAPRGQVDRTERMLEGRKPGGRSSPPPNASGWNVLTPAA